MSELNLIDDYPAQIYTTVNLSAPLLTLVSIVSMQLSLEVQAHVRPQSCETLSNPKDCTLPGFSVHGIFQARILEWVPIFYSRGSPQPRDRTCVSCTSCIGRRILNHCTAWEHKKGQCIMINWDYSRNSKVPSCVASI